MSLHLMKFAGNSYESKIFLALSGRLRSKQPTEDHNTKKKIYICILYFSYITKFLGCWVKKRNSVTGFDCPSNTIKKTKSFK